MDFTISLLAKYGYLILFPLAVIEGPIITIVAGFFVTLGVLNLLAVYIIAVLGDVVGDSGLYFLGKWGGDKVLEKYGKYLGVTQEKIDQAKEFFNKHGKKAVALSKITHGIGMAGLVAAGGLSVPYRRFVLTCLTVTLLQSAIMLTIGIFFGHAYLQIGKYLNIFAAIASILVLAVIVFIILKKYKLFYR